MSAAAMDSGWYYAKRGASAGQQMGPFSWEDLVAHARDGAFAADDFVWHEQLGDWRPAAQIPGLFAPPAPAAAAPAYSQPPGYTAPGGYAPPTGHTTPPAAKSKLFYWLIPLVVVIVVGAGLGVYFGVFYHKEEAFTQKDGEILLEPSGVAGPDAFSGEQFVAVGPSTTLNIQNPQVTLPSLATTTTVTQTAQEASTTAGATPTRIVLVAYPGNTPGLYGGSRSKVIADKDAELAFLEKNPQKAAAFCEALNSDPTLRWSGGNKVTSAQLPAYFAELTPVLLTRDIRVTNYGYRNGHPVPRQSVLQAGQLVLVDRYGVPRKRCECGNPLTPPVTTSKAPVYTGPRWPGFDPGNLIVIQQTTVVTNSFTVIDVNTGETYNRPAGSDGSADGPATETETTEVTTPSSGETTTTIPSTNETTVTTSAGGPVSAGDLNGTWRGTMTITEINVPSDALQAAQEQGCDVSAFETLKNLPLPLTMQITVDPSGTKGTATMDVDVSSVAGSSSGASTPQTIDFTISGNQLTFDLPASEGVATTMTATVGRQGQNLMMTGVMTAAGQGVGLKAGWELTKQTGV